MGVLWVGVVGVLCWCWCWWYAGGDGRWCWCWCLVSGVSFMVVGCCGAVGVGVVWVLVYSAVFLLLLLALWLLAIAGAAVVVLVFVVVASLLVMVVRPCCHCMFRCSSGVVGRCAVGAIVCLGPCLGSCLLLFICMCRFVVVFGSCGRWSIRPGGVYVCTCLHVCIQSGV